MLETPTRDGARNARSRGLDDAAGGRGELPSRTRLIEDQLRLRNAAVFADPGRAMVAAAESRAVRILLGLAGALALLSVLIGAVIVYANLGETEAEVAARMRGVEFIVGGLTVILVLGFYAVSQMIGFVSAAVGVAGGVVVPAVWIGLVSQGADAPPATPPATPVPVAAPAAVAAPPRPPVAPRAAAPLLPDVVVEPPPPATPRPLPPAAAVLPPAAPALLGEAVPPPAPTPPAPAPGIERLQLALRARGFDPGAIDGVLGSRTQTAIRSFQRARNEAATGELTAGQLQALLAAGVGAD